jgi:hypothetical protein
MIWSELLISETKQIFLNDYSCFSLNISTDINTKADAKVTMVDTTGRSVTMNLETINLKVMTSSLGLTTNPMITSIKLWQSGSSYGWHTASISVLAVVSNAYREEFNLKKTGSIPNWYTINKYDVRYCPYDDTDAVQLKMDYGETGTKVWYCKDFQTSNPNIISIGTDYWKTYVYVKYKTDANINTDVCFTMQGTVSSNIKTWSKSIGIKSFVAGRWYIKPFCTSGLMTYNCNDLKIIGISIIVTKSIQTSGSAWYDYIYVSKDLDNDGYLDVTSTGSKENKMDDDVDNDGMKGYASPKKPNAGGGYEWDHGAFYWLSGDGVAEETNGGWQDPYEYNGRYAVLVGGGALDSTNYAAFNNDFIEMYCKLTFQGNYGGYNYNSIYPYFWEASGHPATNWNIINAFKDIRTKITKNDFLFFCVIAHSRAQGNFATVCKNFNGDWVDDDFYYSYIRDLIKGVSFTMYDRTLKDPNYVTVPGGNPIQYARSAFVIQTCYAGSAIPYLTVLNCQGEHPIIMAASKANEIAHGENTRSSPPYQHWAFIWEGRFIGIYEETKPGFIQNMGDLNNPKSLMNAMNWGATAAWFNTDVSYAEIDDNGDGIGSWIGSNHGDGLVAASTYL